jgi:predicted secreted protein
MKILSKIIATLLMITPAMSVFSQQTSNREPLNVAQLSANGSVDVQQDLLAVSMSTNREAADANVVQTQLKTALDAALTEAKKTAQTGQLDIRTGNFSLYPRYGKDGKINGWQGSSELVLEGKDFARISAAAGKIQTLTVANVVFSLSREQRAKAEGSAQSIAMERFKVKAGEIAKGFGFASYTLREVSVNVADQGYVPRPRVVAMDMKMSSAEAAVPVEAGKSTVVVTINGSVQLK